MTNPRQHKKRKKIKLKKRKKTSNKSSSVSICLGPILSEKWKKEKTLEQNYRELGIVLKQNKEKESPRKAEESNGFFSNKKNLLKLKPNEAQILRDDQGNIIKVIYEKQYDFDDELNEIAMENTKAKTQVIEELKNKIKNNIKFNRRPSQNEINFLNRLIELYGDNVDAMAKDIKLNPMQQTAADLRRRISKLKQ
ncbi:hypothetical protein PNEG_00034 [Pneumocystis murina B123]|uniref:Nucleolar protein 16 n=1 Tax=Pneumocystis murina (strain B123) TaxID=1069680 RepID=M7PCF7_PNEMU|nr:hypothetical protein PNEG_00034 [Pneumocystis murina B123]EMR11590.1 hypothetical protein PNEG_00034 [Pneumocystis murina B123]